MADNKGRRRYKRRAASVPVEIVEKDCRYNGLVVNVGRGGTFIITGELLPIREEVIIIYPFSGLKKKKKKGTIIRVEKEGIAVQFHKPNLF